jgi:membrane fusion protein (multidrug efflux system)
MALLVMLLGACGGREGPQRPNAAVPVSVLAIQAQSVTLTRELPGRTTAFLVAEVRPQVSGIIRTRLFKEGSRVEAGQALYQIEDAMYRASYDSARAAVARAQATLETAQLHFGRASELVKTHAVSAQDFDEAKAAARRAEADLLAAQAARQSAGVTLGYARITSPISGRIGKSSVTPGALVTASQDASLATVQQLDPINVDLTVPAIEMVHIRRDLAAGRIQGAGSLPVTILLEDGSRYPHEGRVAFTEVTVNPTTGSFALRVEVPNPDHLLLPGMYVRAIVPRGVREHALLVPQRAVIRDPKGATGVMVIGAQNMAEARAVTVSQTVGDQWLV